MIVAELNGSKNDDEEGEGRRERERERRGLLLWPSSEGLGGVG